MDWRALGIGEKSPAIVNVVIEIPQGEHNKYEYDPSSNSMKLDRILPSFLSYPTNYGFIPQTLSTDGDHLDVLIVSNTLLSSGSVVEARVIGALEMADEKGQDHKIVGVINGEEEMKRVLDIADLNKALLDKIKLFFEDYKKLEENKFSTVGLFENKELAQQEISKCHEAYLKK